MKSLVSSRVAHVSDSPKLSLRCTPGAPLLREWLTGRKLAVVPDPPNNNLRLSKTLVAESEFVGHFPL